MIEKLLRTDDIMLHPLMRMYYRHKYDAKGVVYMLHRVGNYSELSGRIIMNNNLMITPGRLEQIIVDYHKQGFEFLSVDQLYEIIHGIRRQRKPFLVFTLDDGYVDNFTEAYPIFQKYNIPFCIYVATDFPDRKAFLWWYVIEDYLKGYANPNERFYELRSKILSLPKDNFMDEVRSLMPNFHFEVEAYIDANAMTWEQVEELASSPLCTIGGHTVSHPAFKKLSDEEIRKEVTCGIDILEQHINKRVQHFAYPYGSLNEVGEREYEITEKFGFKTIMTTLPGVIKNGTDSNRIPRYILR